MNVLDRQKSIEHLLPNEIEKRSFEIISKELKERGIELPKEAQTLILPKDDNIAVFAITLSDNVMANTAILSSFRIAKDLILNGADIVTDTNMALAGINKKTLAGFGGTVHCFMADETVARIAKERGTTRAAVSMEMATKLKKPLIFAIGNAPTALIQLYEMLKDQRFRPEFIIGVPVGFVNVEAAKELILETEVPHIVNRGRKGGSNVAAAICNAILYELKKEQSGV